MEDSTPLLERCADSLQGLDVLEVGCAHIKAQTAPSGFAAHLGGGFWVLILGVLFAAISIGGKAGDRKK